MKKYALVILCSLMIGCVPAKNTSQQENGLKDAMTPSEISSMTVAEIEHVIVKEHPYSYFPLAAKLFAEGKKQEAVKWFYVGQIRYRAYLKGNPNLDPSADPALFSSLMSTVGPPLNEYIGGDVDEWVRTIDEAIQWHNENPDLFFGKDQHSNVYASVLSGLEKLKKHIAANKDSIRKEREKNGLENR